NIDYIEMSAGDFFQYIIPFILIIIGVIIILRPGRQRAQQQADQSAQQSSDVQDDQSSRTHQDYGMETSAEDHPPEQSSSSTVNPSISPVSPVPASSEVDWD